MRRTEKQGFFLLPEVWAHVLIARRAKLLMLKSSIAVDISTAAALVSLVLTVQASRAQQPERAAGSNQIRTRLYQSFPRTTSHRAVRAVVNEPVAASPDAALKRARAIEKTGDYPHAIDTLASAIKAFPSSQELYLEHADCCIHERRLQDALTDADTALTKGAPKAVIYRRRATANYMLHDYTSCLKDVEQLAKLGPATANDYVMKADCCANLGDTKSTLANLALGLKLDPNNADAYYLRAKTYKQLNQNALADADFKKAMSLEKLPTN